MVNLSSQKYANIARPYALAAFEYARDKQQLAGWKAFLETAASIAKQPNVLKLLANPEVPSADLLALFRDVLASVQDINEERKNFLSVLAQNKRFMLLPAIAEQFDNAFAEFEKISNVRVITAIEANDDFKQALSRSLQNRLKHEVKLHCEVDPSIIGGAIIYIGDRVIDGSVRGKLTRLLEYSLG